MPLSSLRKSNFPGQRENNKLHIRMSLLHLAVAFVNGGFILTGLLYLVYPSDFFTNLMSLSFMKSYNFLYSSKYVWVCIKYIHSVYTHI